MEPTHASPGRTRQLGTASLGGVLVFAAVCVALQFLRPDLDWLQARLSFYLIGDYGWLLKAAYVMLAAALALLGAGYYDALIPSARSRAPQLLLTVSALALCVVVMVDSATETAEITLQVIVHGLAASAAFLCVTVGMMLQSWRLRGDRAWRDRFATAFSLATLSFVAMWVHVLWRTAPRGLTQKLVVALIVAWLALAAWWLRRHRVHSHAQAQAPAQAAEAVTAPEDAS